MIIYIYVIALWAAIMLEELTRDVAMPEHVGHEPAVLKVGMKSGWGGVSTWEKM